MLRVSGQPVSSSVCGGWWSADVQSGQSSVSLNTSLTTTRSAPHTIHPPSQSELSRMQSVHSHQVILGHGGSPQSWIFTSERGKKHYVSLKLECQSGGRTRDLRLYKQAGLTTAPERPFHKMILINRASTTNYSMYFNIACNYFVLLCTPSSHVIYI